MSTASTDLNCQERLSDSPFVERVWRSHSEVSGPFVSMADTHWSMVVTRFHDSLTMTVRGPETRSTPAFSPAGAEFFGIMFRPGTFLRQFPARKVMDRRDIHLPRASSHAFWLHSASWQFPDYENADTFVEWLVRDELLICDPIVDQVLHGHPPRDLSIRTVQRRFLQATGLTHSTLHQIERARYATMLLKQGRSILDTVDLAGYADQPHLTRSLKRFVGQTPSQLVAANRQDALSFLFKTPPF